RAFSRATLTSRCRKSRLFAVTRDKGTDKATCRRSPRTDHRRRRRRAIALLASPAWPTRGSGISVGLPTGFPRFGRAPVERATTETTQALAQTSVLPRLALVVHSTSGIQHCGLATRSPFRAAAGPVRPEARRVDRCDQRLTNANERPGAESGQARSRQPR